MNEGHAAFLQLERIREFVQEGGLPFAAALWAARADSLFTTHTPVPAGNDTFPFELMERFFSAYWGRLGLDRDRFMALGRWEQPWGWQFSMTVLALRTSGLVNGVSRLHREVSRKMWQGVWPGVPLAEVPISYVTNGVHSDSWLHPRLAALCDRYLGAGWRDALDARATWLPIADIPDAELWAAHQAAKQQMLALVRERTVDRLMRLGAGPVEVNAAARMLDPNALTIGFGRRFATYKRANLIFRDGERLKRILNNPERPVQIIFSGKAHPADEPAKKFIELVYQMSQQPGFAGRVVFLEDYDANLARHMVTGVDLWLNNPRRPLEASGTSGQKASLNGIPNFSVLDGWWAEGYNGANGWAIGAEREYASEAAQDEADALSLYATLENAIVPCFYDRGPALSRGGHETGLPAGWLAVLRAAMATVAPDFSFARMLKEYVTKFYIPAGALRSRIHAQGYAAARALAEWEARILGGWSQVSLTASGPARGEMAVGRPLEVQATLRPGLLSPDDLAVELVYGHAEGGDLRDAAVLPMQQVSGAPDPTKGGRDDACACSYTVQLDVPESGAFSYGVRVRPHHPDLPNPFAAGLVKWASGE